MRTLAHCIGHGQDCYLRRRNVETCGKHRQYAASGNNRFVAGWWSKLDPMGDPLPQSRDVIAQTPARVVVRLPSAPRESGRPSTRGPTRTFSPRDVVTSESGPHRPSRQILGRTSRPFSPGHAGPQELNAAPTSARESHPPGSLTATLYAAPPVQRAALTVIDQVPRRNTEPPTHSPRKAASTPRRRCRHRLCAVPRRQFRSSTPVTRLGARWACS